MADKSVADRVKEIIVEQLGVNPDQVTPEAKSVIPGVADNQALDRKLPDQYIATNHIYIQQPNQKTGQPEYARYGPPFRIPGNPLTGSPEMLPPNPLTAIVGQTPLHTNYQVINYPYTATTPLNLFSYPRVYTPYFSPQHPFNLHHPFNHVYGMHPYMFTGDPASAANLFINPFVASQTGTLGMNYPFPSGATAGGFPGGGPTNSASENFGQQVDMANQNAGVTNINVGNIAPQMAAGNGFNPGFGNAPQMPAWNGFNQGFGNAFNPLMGGFGGMNMMPGSFGGVGMSTPPWPYLSGYNAGMDPFELQAISRRLKSKRRTHQVHVARQPPQTSADGPAKSDNDNKI